MATGKVLNAANSSSFSLSQGFKSIFFCCFPPSSSSEKAAEAQKKRHEDNCGREETVGRSKDASVEVKEKEQSELKEEKEEAEAKGVERSIISGNCSDKGSLVGDELFDSAIDSASLNSQLNCRDIVDAEMKSGQVGESGEQVSGRHDIRNDITGQDAVIEGNGGNSSADVATRIDSARGVSVSTADTAGDATEISSGLIEGDSSMTATAANEDAAINAANVDKNVIGQCGRVHLTLDYDAGRHHLLVTVHEASDIPDSDRVNLSHSEIHLLLQHPVKKLRHQTKPKSGDKPHFEETFHFTMSSDELAEAGLRVRLYRSEWFKKERMIGESYFALSSFPVQENHCPHSFWLTLEPRFNLISNLSADNASSRDEVAMTSAQSSMTSGPASELMLGLSYNGTTGRLSVDVIQACNLRNATSHKPTDTYIKLRLISPSGSELARSKTAVRRRDPNPAFHETFIFHVSQFQLPDVSLMVSVCEHRSMKHNQMLAWFTLGQTNSSEESKSHWKAMIESKGEQISRWHNLMKP